MTGPFQAVALAKVVYDNQVRYILPDPDPFERLSEPSMTQWLKDAGEMLEALHAAGWTLAPLPSKPHRDPKEMAGLLDLANGDHAKAERWYDDGVRVTWGEPKRATTWGEPKRATIDPEFYERVRKWANESAAPSPSVFERTTYNGDRRFWPIDKPLPWWRKFWPF